MPHDGMVAERSSENQSELQGIAAAKEPQFLRKMGINCKLFHVEQIVATTKTTHFRQDKRAENPKTGKN